MYPNVATFCWAVKWGLRISESHAPRYLVLVKRRKAAGDRREQMLRIRVTSAEKEGLANAAARMGLGLSSWLRMIALREAGLLEPLAIRKRH